MDSAEVKVHIGMASHYGQLSLCSQLKNEHLICGELTFSFQIYTQKGKLRNSLNSDHSNA